MTAQTSLPLSVPISLTERQQTALDLLIAHGPLRAREWGRLVHAAQGKHSGERFCAYCESAGVELGKALRAKKPPLVKLRYRRNAREKRDEALEEARRCLYAFVNCQERGGDTCNEWLADAIRALAPPRQEPALAGEGEGERG